MSDGFERGITLRDLVDRAPVDVEALIDVPVRLPPHVALAAHVLVSEALANTVKHAEAEHVEVRAQVEGERLVVEVGDDGVGGADMNGAGLTELADRLHAVGGRLEVSSPVEGGTVVRAELPLDSA